MTDNETADLALTVYAPDEDEAEIDEAGAGGGAGALDPGTTARGIALAAERDRLARALRETHRQLATAESQLMSVKRSATMELGQAIVAAAKRPWIGGPRLPKHLYRMWREHRAVRAAGSGLEAGGFRSADEARWARILLDAGAGAAGDRFLSAYTVPGLAWSATGRAEGQDMADGLVVAGVLTDASCAALAPDATAEQLLPHDAAFVLEGSGADLVLIEAAALLPGGAWAHAGDPAATDRGRRLADLIDLARALGKPVIFLRNAPSYLMPFLDWLGTSCDAVVDGGLGVQLARFNPIDLPAARGAVPVYAGHRDPREGPAVKRMLDELTGAEPDGGQDGGRPGGRAGRRGDPARPARVIGEPSWRTAPDVYRQHAVFLAATAAQAREQLACGARVVGPVTEDAAVSGVTGGASGRSAADAGETARQLAAAAAGPRGLAEIKATLLELFETYATPARLAELGRLVDLPARPVPGRRVAVLAGVRDAADAGRLAERVLGQRLRPHEVRVWLEGDMADDMAMADPANAAARAAREHIGGALAPLTAEGIIVGVVTGTGLAAAARAAVSPWAAEWDPQLAYPASYLLELMCALECSRADAVGPAAGADYAFTDVLDPAVARTDLFREGAPPRSTWARRGLRLFAVAPAAPAGGSSAGTATTPAAG
jgi:hypothetical protein